MSAEDFLKTLMEERQAEEYVSIADFDEYGNVVYTNSVVTGVEDEGTTSETPVSVPDPDDSTGS